jgi:hypothetical protein
MTFQRQIYAIAWTLNRSLDELRTTRPRRTTSTTPSSVQLTTCNGCARSGKDGRVRTGLRSRPPR